MQLKKLLIVLLCQYYFLCHSCYGILTVLHFVLLYMIDSKSWNLFYQDIHSFPNISQCLGIFWNIKSSFLFCSLASMYYWYCVISRPSIDINNILKLLIIKRKNTSFKVQKNVKTPAVLCSGRKTHVPKEPSSAFKK